MIARCVVFRGPGLSLLTKRVGSLYVFMAQFLRVFIFHVTDDQNSPIFDVCTSSTFVGVGFTKIGIHETPYVLEKSPPQKREPREGRKLTM